MAASRFEKPSVTTLAAATVTAVAVAFVRCGGPGPQPSPPGSPATSPAPEPAPPSALPETTPPRTPPETTPSASAVAAPPAPKQKVVVAALGDSLTDAKSAGGRYLEVLQKRCPESRFDNFGKGGDMVNQIRKRFERDVLTNGTDYTHLLVFGGVNDLYSDLTAGRTPAKISADLAAIYQAAHARGWKVIALTVAPWGGFTKYYNDKRGAATRELNEWISAQVAAKKVDWVVDAHGLLSCGDPDRLCKDLTGSLKDGLHFGAPGHDKLGAAIYDQVFTSCR
ncbi:MAG: SGNH/GDSL hydrolase family protein [Polyangiaceae bacterium]|nr:SGNH/GDSL hydrolase family protein [Polyangiaceae bacterium]